MSIIQPCTPEFITRSANNWRIKGERKNNSRCVSFVRSLFTKRYLAIYLVFFYPPATTETSKFPREFHRRLLNRTFKIRLKIVSLSWTIKSWLKLTYVPIFPPHLCPHSRNILFINGTELLHKFDNSWIAILVATKGNFPAANKRHKEPTAAFLHQRISRSLINQPAP